MLYNVYIINNVAVKVTEHNSSCSPCNSMGAIPSERVQIVNVNLPQGYKENLPILEAIKQYINLNHLI